MARKSKIESLKLKIFLAKDNDEILDLTKELLVSLLIETPSAGEDKPKARRGRKPGSKKASVVKTTAKKRGRKPGKKKPGPKPKNEVAEV
jgi:hypothetical protein